MSYPKVFPPPTQLAYRLFIALLICALAFLGACGRDEPTPTPTAVASEKAVGGLVAAATNAAATSAPAVPAATAVPVQPTPPPLTGHVTIWHSWSQGQSDALAAVLAQLKRALPGVRTDSVFVVPDLLMANYTEAVKSGNAPDLLIAPNWSLGGLVDGNAILNLDSRVGGNLDTSYWPAAVASMRYKGALYGFPLTYNLVALYVNKNLVPSTGIPINTDAMLAAAAITQTSGVGIYATLFHTYWGLPAFGAQLLNDQGVAVLDQNSGAAAYLAWLKTLDNTPGSYVDSDYGMLLDRFKKGEFAYLVDGPWEMADLHTVLGDALAVSPLPAGPAGPAQPWLYSDGIFVNPTISQTQQTLALNVALLLSGDQAGTTLATVGNLLPAARNADLSKTPLLQGFAAQVATAAAMPTTPEVNEVWNYGNDMIVKALTGVADPPAVVTETNILINEANNK